MTSHQSSSPALTLIWRGLTRSRGPLCRLLGWTLLFSALAGLNPLTAADQEIWVFYRPDIPLYVETLHHLPSHSSHTFVSCPVGKTSASFIESHPPDLAIALGDAGLQQALDMHWEVPIVAALVEQDFSHPRVLVLETPQPHSLQVQLLSRLAPSCTTLWYPYASDRFAPGPGLQKAADRAGLRLESVRIADPRELPKALRILASPATAALLPPDPSLMNTAVIQTILLAAFRSHSLVIGFSESLVKQGATFAYALTPDNLAATLADLVDKPAPGDQRSRPPRVFSRWSLVINATILGKMDLPLPDDVGTSAAKRF